MKRCVFCQIVKGEEPATIVRRWPDHIAIEPLNPVTPGHLLVIPHQHVPDAGVWPAVTGDTFQAAAELINEIGPANLITSAGEAATQTVMHLHVHVVPRRSGDGLHLPWTT